MYYANRFSDIDLYILNEKNQYITKKFISELLKKYDVEYIPKDIELYQRSMIHQSYVKKDDEYWSKNKSSNTNKNLDMIENRALAMPLMTESYERLEFVGDSVIHTILALYLYQRYPNESEGFMTRLRSNIEKGDALSILSKICGLNNYVIISRYIEKKNGRENNEKIMEDVFEAFIGALRIEAGYDITERFLINLIEEEIDFSEILHSESNYKDVLLKEFHKRKWKAPIYGELSITGPDHCKIFKMYVAKKENDRSKEEIISYGKGKSKKHGEQDAARIALIKLGALKEENNEDDTFIEEIE